MFEHSKTLFKEVLGDLGCLISQLSSLQTMLEYELLHKSLFALCVEIVLFSYNSQSRSATLVLHDGHMAIT